MDEQQLFEIAAKLHNVRPDQLRLKRRYLDVIVIELMDGAKFTYYVADLESMAAGESDSPRDLPASKPSPRAGTLQNTRKR
jgi:hypothetical protein